MLMPCNTKDYYYQAMLKLSNAIVKQCNGLICNTIQKMHVINLYILTSNPKKAATLNAHMIIFFAHSHFSPLLLIFNNLS